MSFGDELWYWSRYGAGVGNGDVFDRNIFDGVAVPEEDWEDQGDQADQDEEFGYDEAGREHLL